MFSRSELRREVLNTVDMEGYSDAGRPRVKKWSMCPLCKTATPKYLMVVDHIDPVVPIGEAFETMNLHIVRDRLWCEKNNLRPCCKPCHNSKTRAEAKQRKQKRKKNNE